MILTTVTFVTRRPNGFYDSKKTHHYTLSLTNFSRAILHQLENPNPGFEDVIRLHFRLKKNEVLEQSTEWLKEHNDSESLEKLKKLLENL